MYIARFESIGSSKRSGVWQMATLGTKMCERRSISRGQSSSSAQCSASGSHALCYPWKKDESGPGSCRRHQLHTKKPFSSSVVVPTVNMAAPTWVLLLDVCKPSTSEWPFCCLCSARMANMSNPPTVPRSAAPQPFLTRSRALQEARISMQGVFYFPSHRRLVFLTVSLCFSHPPAFFLPLCVLHLPSPVAE